MSHSKFSLDHIGVAVKSLTEAFKFWKALGFENIETEEVPSEKVRVGFLPMNNGADIELLEATNSDSTIAKFITKRGEGIHHICLKVENLQETLDQLKADGIRLIDEKPRVGAKNCLVAFVHPSSCNGMLVELSQPRGETK